jgi:glycosyltransferase involved in cell wall biosynthesis
MNLTIVIPCKNEAKYIEDTLNSLNNQIGIEGINVIVADARSDDGTFEILKDFRKRETTKFNLHIVNGGPVGYARNKGASFLRKSKIIFIDADVTLPNNLTIKSTYQLLNEFDLVTCNFESRSQSFMSKLAFKSFNFVRNNLMQEPFAVGGYFATTRKAFELYDKFDESVTHSEDYLLSRKYNPEKFAVITSMIATQDDRRFKKMGYFNFLWMLFINYINRNNINHYRKDIKYWD